jgi:hypothetical protein
MEQSPYIGEELNRDRDYCLKKLGLKEEEFEELMNLPIKSHFDYEVHLASS